MYLWLLPFSVHKDSKPWYHLYQQHSIFVWETLQYLDSMTTWMMMSATLYPPPHLQRPFHNPKKIISLEEIHHITRYHKTFFGVYTKLTLSISSVLRSSESESTIGLTFLRRFWGPSFNTDWSLESESILGRLCPDFFGGLLFFSDLLNKGLGDNLEVDAFPKTETRKYNE